MKFQYEAITKEGEVETGTLAATSSRDALRQVSAKGLLALDVTAEQKLLSGDPVKAKQVAILQMLDELSTLLTAGVALFDAVDSLAESQMDPHMKVALDTMAQGLQQGKSFSVVLLESGLKIPDYMYQLSKAGELTGQLSLALAEGVVQMQGDADLVNETKNALIYPSVLVFSGVVAVGLVFSLVVPKFSNLLKGEAELPFLASAVLKTGMFFNAYTLELVAALVLVIVAIVSALKKPAVRQSMMNAMSSWPVVGPWLIESVTRRWTSILGALLQRGVPLIESIQLANNGVAIPARKRKLDLAMQTVKSGVPLSKALQEQDALLPTAYNILKVGETAGELPSMLKSLATLYEKSSKNRMRKMLILIEPIAILLIGSAIGVIILGIVLAITSASDVPL